MISVVNQSPANDKGWILRPVALDGFSFPWPTLKKEIITKEVSENEEEVDEDDILEFAEYCAQLFNRSAMNEKLPSIPKFRDPVESLASLPTLEEVNGDSKPGTALGASGLCPASISCRFRRNDWEKAHKISNQMVCQLCQRYTYLITKDGTRHHGRFTCKFFTTVIITNGCHHGDGQSHWEGRRLS